jgi:hypothetical protein
MRFRPLVVLPIALVLALCPFAFAAEPGPVEAEPPTAYTRGAESLLGSNSEELLFGFVETNGLPTRYRLQFGRTKSYGRHVYNSENPYAYNGPASVGVEGIAGRLHPDTTYHYRLVVWNELGKSLGEDRTFHTGKARRY